MEEWEDLAEFWLGELEDEGSYAADIVPLVHEVLPQLAHRRVLELGCGEGRIMRLVAGLGGSSLGVDINERLARRARKTSPVVVSRLPSLGCFRSDVVDVVVAVLVIEHLSDLPSLCREAARVCRPGGTLSLVMNHPLYTAPKSAPVVDPSDGELFWRWGSYLREEATIELIGGRTVTFHHRPLASLFNAAAAAGWVLDHVVERPVVLADAPESTLEGQQNVPRLLGARWRLTVETHNGEPEPS